MTDQIGKRLKARREDLELTQEQLARRMGLPHRQTLGAIENGERNIQPEELAAAAQALGVPPDYFTDRFSAGGEAVFSFRAEAVADDPLRAFEEQAGRWLATYRELGRPSVVTRSLALTQQSSYEEAQEAAEETRRELGLGDYPAFELEEALEREWGILVLYVDPPAGVSGAASRLSEVQAILINRSEPRGRRHYDLAHELFHLLTWDTIPPPRLDATSPPRGQKRMEELANNFAAALLMPRRSVEECWAEHEVLPVVDRIRAMAARFGVTGPAMKWRLLNLDRLTSADLPEDSEVGGVPITGDQEDGVRPQLFNTRFVSRLHRAVEEGRLSVRKASRIAGTDTAGLADLFRSHGRTLSYDV